jgi:spore maturation protein SpmB
MNVTADIINRGKQDALRAALAIMGASLTDAQISIIASAFSGLTANEIRMALNVVQPPEE